MKFCSYNPSSNFSIYLWNGVLLFGQPLHNHHACKVVTALQDCECLRQKCHNLVTITVIQPYKVVARLLQPRNVHIRYLRVINLSIYFHVFTAVSTLIEYFLGTFTWTHEWYIYLKGFVHAPWKQCLSITCINKCHKPRNYF